MKASLGRENTTEDTGLKVNGCSEVERSITRKKFLWSL